MKWIFLLMALGVASLFMVGVFGYMSVDMRSYGAMTSGFVFCIVGLRVSLSFGRIKSRREIFRFMGGSVVFVLVAGALIAILLGSIWYEPAHDFANAQVTAAACGDFTGKISEGWEEFCAERMVTQPPQ